MHGQDGHGRTRVSIFQSQSLLQCVQVFRIEDGRQGGTVYGTLCGHGIFPHIACVGYLLCQYYNFQTHLTY